MTMSEASVDDVTAFVCKCVFSFVCVALFFLRMLKPHFWPNLLLPVLNPRFMAASVSVLCAEIRWPIELCSTTPGLSKRNWKSKLRVVQKCGHLDEVKQLWCHTWSPFVLFQRTLFKQTLFKVAIHLTRKVLWFLQEHWNTFLTGGGCNCNVPFLLIILPSEVWYRCNPCSANCSPDKTVCLYVCTHSRVSVCVCSPLEEGEGVCAWGEGGEFGANLYSQSYFAYLRLCDYLLHPIICVFPRISRQRSHRCAVLLLLVISSCVCRNLLFNW